MFEVARGTPVLVLLVLLASFVGCGSGQSTHIVKGKVVFSDGTPVQFGDVETLSVEHRINARGKIEKDGTFTLTTYEENDGAVAGEHQVVIIQMTGTPMMAAAKLGPIQHTHGHDTGAKYRSYDTSGLKFTVEPGKVNEVTFTLDDFTPGKSGHSASSE
ncbi:MAG: carboxypeptidase regulatory-like domain-containing protein [Planctomycetaceae bacterium]|nr:carboxypeptidase regulatory-like domain-containing protein [Planctomycetaceae bacterium]